MHLINIAGRQIQFTLVFKKRKTIQLKIVGPNMIQISAPTKTPKDDICAVIQSKKKWLIEKLDHLQKLSENPINKSLSHGSEILFMGTSYLLQYDHISNCLPSVQRESGIIRISLNESSNPNSLLKKWYIDQATQLLYERTTHWSKKIGVQPKRVVLKEQKSRWGSCSSLGNINLNWRIIMGPNEIIDYVIVHEICHLIELNHSSKFWHLVNLYLPNYKECRGWLKQNGCLLSLPF
ncbi:M48 family metallopeptidase [Dendrosporobacter sp. 1207_IL3150]|uniref:M48 family metallopeptidase n=1 Tax=Dendrosporobacter sp. 1207_IL3150 TaxID=3084054 RepID=UPI002FD988DD